ncbi:MAG: ABC transporter ATP-binding protein [Propionibacteriaceae bacterium]|nr:ABC transporter ATP-binding protein [Propionibacteriaceae bacterium]
MPEIVLSHVTKRWNRFFGVDDLSLHIPDNAFVTLLGPSGCGKTTTLRMIAGLESPTSGKITIGGQTVFDSAAGIDIPANKRRVGFLFQNYALWPNMTVHQNIAFGLQNIKEELPVVDVDAQRAAGLVRALSRPADVKELVLDCHDKKGKLDEAKARIRLIDTFEISMSSAKELLKLGLHSAADPGAVAAGPLAAARAAVEAARQRHAAAGESLNEAFEVTTSAGPATAVRKLSAEEIDLRVRRVSRIVKIGPFMDRYPSELSGGQQQRVAIARTLAPGPGVLFMDEPLSNLDAKLRLEMRSELQRLHVNTGSTFVYVTHDQMEAMTLATRICLMDNGVLQQYDPPLDVYNRPNNLFVADFVGNPSINFVNGRGSQAASGAVELDVFGGAKAVFTPTQPVDLAAWFAAEAAADAAAAEAEQARLAVKGAVEKENKESNFRYRVARADATEEVEEAEPTDADFVLGIRPEALEIRPSGALPAEIYASMPTGMETTVKVTVGGLVLTGVIFGPAVYQIGQKVKVDIDGSGVLLFSRRNGRLIAQGSLAFAAA